MILPRIGIDARLIATREGGIAEYMRRMIEQFALLDHPYPMTIIEGRHVAPRAAPPLPNWHIYRAQTPCHHKIERVALGVELLPQRLALLHSMDFIPPRFGARRFVITIHDLNFLYYPQFQTPDSFRYYNGQIEAATRRADHILADSEATRQDLIERLKVAPNKVTTHYMGVDPAFRPLPAEAVDPVLARYQLPRGYLLHVGTFEPRKNLEGLFTAYAALLGRLPDLPPLVCVGRRGWLYKPIFQKVAALGLQERVIWLENVPFRDLPALYNGAGVLVMPSFYEGFGFPPLEAMACGTVTVVADRSSLPEVVGDVGWRVDPDDPQSIANGVYLSIQESEARTRFREAGLRRAATFTWERPARIVLEIYRRLLA
jgi:glycosyltransferase involved in cell wall biosynthesis